MCSACSAGSASSAALWTQTRTGRLPCHTYGSAMEPLPHATVPTEDSTGDTHQVLEQHHTPAGPSFPSVPLSYCCGFYLPHVISGWRVKRNVISMQAKGDLKVPKKKQKLSGQSRTTSTASRHLGQKISWASAHQQASCTAMSHSTIPWPQPSQHTPSAFGTTSPNCASASSCHNSRGCSKAATEWGHHAELSRVCRTPGTHCYHHSSPNSKWHRAGRTAQMTLMESLDSRSPAG